MSAVAVAVPVTVVVLLLLGAAAALLWLRFVRPRRRAAEQKRAAQLRLQASSGFKVRHGLPSQPREAYNGAGPRSAGQIFELKAMKASYKTLARSLLNCSVHDNPAFPMISEVRRPRPRAHSCNPEFEQAGGVT